eukprot:gene5709-6293_t
MAVSVRNMGSALLFLLTLSGLVSGLAAASLESLIPEIGGTFCKYLAYKGQIHRRYLRDCPEQSCVWHDWQSALSSNTSSSSSSQRKERVVLSYGHNGFGNQLWEHSVAFMIAESLNAKLLVGTIPDQLSPGGFLPPNTWAGMTAMEALLPRDSLFDRLPANDSARLLCEQETFYISDRPIDWKNRNYTSTFRERLVDLLTDPRPRCLRLLGYFQNLPLCANDARRLWTSRLLTNVTTFPGEDDLSVYLRCVPRHYHFNSKAFYEAVLTRVSYKRLWLFLAPECPSKLGDNPARDGPTSAVLRLLYSQYNATRWPQTQSSDENAALLHDLGGLILSKKLILPVSSWAFWAGFLSNASEIHVNAPPLHAVMAQGDDPGRYIYHSERARLYHGRYNTSSGDIDYGLDLSKEASPATARRLVTTLSSATPPSATLDDYQLYTLHLQKQRLREMVNRTERSSRVFSVAAWMLSLALCLLCLVAIAWQGQNSPCPSPSLLASSSTASRLSYSLADSYQSADRLFSDAKSYLLALKAEETSFQFCDNLQTVPVDWHFSSHSPTLHSSFQPHHFLRANKNANIFIVGDSLGRQLFAELRTALTHSEQKCAPPPPGQNCSNSFTAACYGDWNVTVVFMFDRFMRAFYKGSDLSRCGYPLESMTHTVVAAGHWFKPYHPPLSRAPNNMTYSELVATLAERLRATLKEARRALQRANEKINVIWRTIAHVGMCAEWDVFPSAFEHLSSHRNQSFQRAMYRDGLFWSNLSLEAPWVLPFNDVIRSLAEEHCGDAVLDSYSLSHRFLRLYEGQPVAVHFDCIHNCPGGVPRGEILLLQALMEEFAR